MLHLVGIDKYLVFFDVASKYCNLCHTTCGEQARTDGPVGYGAQVEHGCCVGGESYYHHFAQDGRLRSEGRGAYIVGKLVGYGCQLFRYNLAGKVDVSVPFELNPHDGESCCG